MGLALLVFPTPDDSPDQLRTILKRVQADHASLARYWTEFDPQPQNRPPSATTKDYEGAQKQLTSLKRLIRKLSLDYPQEARKSLRHVLKDEAVRIYWQELCDELDNALEGIAEIEENNYSRTQVWLRLRPVILAYPDVIQAFQEKLRREPR